ncbi:MAG: SpoIID/LytB domain-containing protein, partial [Candidatus Omnitrophica bacterium]|nr:SpoIID/LytB domain-containing protein [Candidatus Omnitrophota bacterium]
DMVIKTRGSGFIVGRGTANAYYRFMTFDGGKIIVTDKDKQHWVVDEAVVIAPARPHGCITVFEVPFGQNDFWENIEDRSYRGTIEISVVDQKLSVINVIGLEEYLYGVVRAEMPATWPLEALKAQAVAARSETMAKLGRHRKEGFDLCANVHCQVYAGVGKETRASNLAVDQTRGQVLQYDGRPVDAVYSSNCGGHTQENVFSKRGVAYFKGTPDMPEAGAPGFPLSPLQLEQWLKAPGPGIYCDLASSGRSSNFRWVRLYSAQELRSMVSQILDIGAIRSLKVARRNPSGHIAALAIIGEKGELILEQELKIRSVLGNLRSSMFKVEVRYGKGGKAEQFVFYGGGWGHGVGMCQAGCRGMALAGKEYSQILGHYYASTQMKKLY